MRLKLSLIILVVIAIFGIAGFWFWNKNIYSKEVVRLEILAPKEADVGEEIEYSVKYKNNGNVRLEKASLIFEYPTGAVVSQKGSQRTAIQLDDIYPGQEQTIQFRARLFGKEGDVKKAKAFLSYTPRNLTATFRSETTATTVIAFVPLTFELDIPSKAASGQQLEFSLNYFSNIDYPLSGLRVRIEYPDGFSFQQSSPSSPGENEWGIGVLNRADGGRISIKGILKGDVGEAKLFSATIGTWKDGDFTLLAETTKGIQLTKPRLFISQVVNGSVGYIASPGDTLHYEIFFKNISDKDFESLFLIVDLEGRPFDFSSVQVSEGSFTKGSNSLIWEARDIPRLQFLGRGEQGSVDFWINLQDDWDIISPQEKNFALKSRVLLSDVKEEFEIKINSRITVEQTGYFQDEVFGNSGPLPLKVGERTTYTITWKARNYYNDVKSVRVKAQLPVGVELTGQIFPESSPLAFDSVSRELVWEVGGMGASSGILTPAPSVTFQISLIPSDSQKGTTPMLIGQAIIRAEDDYTERLLSSSDSLITTALLDDETISPQMGVVQ